MSGSVYLAFDYGQKRIGAAVGDSLTRSARPLAAVANGDWAAIWRLIAEW
ncbi:MAG: Holliday junction resolvase RuvX, partial [Stenotrophobium sp.]